MDEDMQALFMQARIVRLANLRWGMPLAETARLLMESGALEYVREIYNDLALKMNYTFYEDIIFYP